MIYELYLAVYMTHPPRIIVCDSPKMARGIIYDWQGHDLRTGPGAPGYKMGYVFPLTVVIGAEEIEPLKGEEVDNYGHFTNARKAG